MTNQLPQVIEKSGLELTESKSILAKFGDYEALASEWEVKAKAIVVTNVNQTTEMAMAREARKKFSQLRIDVEKARKEMKEQSLRKGQAIDAVAKFLTSLIAPIEDHLRKQEDFIKIQDEQRLEAERIELAKKAEEERIAQEKLKAEEDARIRAENERLKKEADEAQKKFDAEKKELEDKAEKAEKATVKIEKKLEKITKATETKAPIVQVMDDTKRLLRDVLIEYTVWLDKGLDVKLVDKFLEKK